MTSFIALLPLLIPMISLYFSYPISDASAGFDTLFAVDV